MFTEKSVRTRGSERGVSESEVREIGLKHVAKGTEYFKKGCDRLFIIPVSLWKWSQTEETRTGETKPKNVSDDRTDKEAEKGS